MIPQRNISLITNELATESGRRIPEAIISHWIRGICAVCEGLILLVSRAGSDFFTPQKNERMRAGGLANCQFLDFHPKMQ